jgi:16S rRNA (guanine1516-N2)-methyltransferase
VISICAASPDDIEAAQSAASRYGFTWIESKAQYPYLEFGAQTRYHIDKRTALIVDFTSGANAHRKKYGGKELITKAVAAIKGERPSILDATAGMGRDAYVLAHHGCLVTLVERHPVVYLLLSNGIQRAQEQGDPAALRMTLIGQDSNKHLRSDGPRYDVIYLDPMFPAKQKSAAVKKDMQAFHSLVGKDSDNDALLELALNQAKNRVVVKRPDYAPPLNQRQASFQYSGKKIRYDVYLCS